MTEGFDAAVHVAGPLTAALSTGWARGSGSGEDRE
jgi:hypothetical protein